MHKCKMKNQKYKKNKNTKKTKNGFRRRSRKHIKGGLRTDWKETSRANDYIIYMSELHPGIHITYRDETNFHATPHGMYRHFGHNGRDGPIEFFGKGKTTTDQTEINKLKNAWISFKDGPIHHSVVCQMLSGEVFMRPPTPRGRTNIKDYPDFDAAAP